MSGWRTATYTKALPQVKTHFWTWSSLLIFDCILFELSEMEERGRIPVDLPHEKPTTSYWQDPPDRIADLRTTVELPSHADYVVVGSGITGVCIAYNILAREPGANVVLLEARQACSGATGRNGNKTGIYTRSDQR